VHTSLNSTLNLPSPGTQQAQTFPLLSVSLRNSSSSYPTLTGKIRVSWLDGRGSIFSKNKMSDSIPQGLDTVWAPPNLLFSGYWGGVLSQRVKRPEPEADHLSMHSAVVKNVGALPPHVFVALCLIN
jgi:hypothetical protein